MKSFLKRVLLNLAAFLASMFVLGVSAIVLLALLSVWITKEATKLERDTYLVIDLGISINDSPGGSAVDQVMEELVGGNSVPRISLREWVQVLEAAASDRHIVGIVITGSLLSENYGSGYGVLEEARAAIERFRESGKPVYAWLRMPSYKDYLLASAADEIHLSPGGLFPWNGLAIEGIFFSDFLKRNGVRMHVFEAGEFKGASDTFTRRDFSQGNRKQLQRYLDTQWRNVVEKVSHARGIPADQLRRLGDQVGLLEPNEALQAGLIDAVSWYDQFLGILRERTPDYNQVTLADYRYMLSYSGDRDSEEGKARIGIVYLEGDIVPGESVYPGVGGTAYSREIRRLREDSEVKAVVIRVNSPGGVAFAGEEIAREVELTSKEKPVVISMGTLAASAGYMVAAPGNVIFAEPSTLTGSIGAFMMFPDFEQLGKEYGVTSDAVVTGPLANLTSVLKQPNSRQRAIYERFLQETYRSFLALVEKHRKLSKDELKAVAEGRIWMGEEALANGLVDRIGGIEDAVAHAQELAGLKEDGFVIEEFPARVTPADFWNELFGKKGDYKPLSLAPVDMVKPMLPRSLLQVARSFSVLTQEHQNSTVYLRLPFWVE